MENTKHTSTFNSADIRIQNEPETPLNKQQKTSTVLSIIFVCALIAIPLAAFCSVFLALVFQKQLTQTTCLYPDLCPIINGTRSDSYYVQFSAASLVFITSWSSTFSLAMLGLLMTLFSYKTAASFLRASSSNKHAHELPTPFQLNLIIQILSGGPLSICNFICILIQAADTWLHITTETVPIIRLNATTKEESMFSRGLAPWCINRAEGVGTRCNNAEYAQVQVGTANDSTTHTLVNDRNQETRLLNYTDAATGIDFAVLAPANVPDGIDFTASTFAVSTQCSALTREECNLTSPSSSVDYRYRTFDFDCLDKSTGRNLSGTILLQTNTFRYLDFNRYIYDTAPYKGENGTMIIVGLDCIDKDCRYLGEHDQVFKNPWYWSNMPTISTPNSDPEKDELVFGFENFKPNKFAIVDCNTTVFDVVYHSLAGQVSKIVNMTQSNASVAGIASMAEFPGFGINPQNLVEVSSEYADFQLTNPNVSVKDALRYYALGMSRLFLAHIGSQSSPRGAIQAQQRSTILVSQVSKAALWCFIAANGVFVLVAIVLTMFAVRASMKNASVSQLQARLTVPGIVAELLEKPYSERSASGEMDLYRENAGLQASRVRARETDLGGCTLQVR
ncbi:hypothetical protein EJ04DRAFT_574309 [Polyplosphaeria fusca]|uniref:Uncharacterized protein n=1 Tax=Polyplosphaeria fusca TaxID=682080 RepID=A0A9P4R488_9PLEO|nr:hypothetical protein EJ04DRAFT_574309 [Polyplosphaeria fusca]